MGQMSTVRMAMVRRPMFCEGSLCCHLPVPRSPSRVAMDTPQAWDVHTIQGVVHIACHRGRVKCGQTTRQLTVDRGRADIRNCILFNGLREHGVHAASNSGRAMDRSMSLYNAPIARDRSLLSGHPHGVAYWFGPASRPTNVCKSARSTNSSPVRLAHSQPPLAERPKQDMNMP